MGESIEPGDMDVNTENMRAPESENAEPVVQSDEIMQRAMGLALIALGGRPPRG